MIEKLFVWKRLPTVRPPAIVEVSLEVAVNEPAKALVPRSEEPTTERVLSGLVVPIPRLPATE